MSAGPTSEVVHRSAPKSQLLVIAAGLVLATVLVLFPIWKNEEGGVWYRYAFAPELGRGFVLERPTPHSVVHRIRVWWDIAIVAVATVAFVWVAAPRATDGRTLIAAVAARRVRIALVVASCVPLPGVPAPLWAIIVSVLAAGGVGSHHLGLPAPIAVGVLLLAGVLYSGVLCALLVAVPHVVSFWGNMKRHR